METSGDLIKFSDVKKFVGDHLKTAAGIEQFVITYAEHQESAHQWKVDVEYKENISGILWTTSAALMLDDKTGQVKSFFQGRRWAT